MFLNDSCKLDCPFYKKVRYALIQTLYVGLIKTANWFSLYYCKHYNVLTVIIKIKNKKDIGNKNKSKKPQIFYGLRVYIAIYSSK